MKLTAPLSTSQFGIYVECANHQGEPCYNLPFVYVLDRSLDGQRLLEAVETAFKAHPTLFTRIELGEDGEPVQTLDVANEQWTLNIEDIQDIEQEKAQFVEPFNIYGDRLFHIHLLRDANHLYLFLDYHHIIVDGTSMNILLHDINDAYNGIAIEGEGISLAEIVQKEVEDRKSPAFEEAKQWFANNFDCGDTYTPLIPDVEEIEHTEDSLLRTLSINMADVDNFCQQHGIFKSTLFTQVYAYLLAKFNNEQESLFNTVYNGRSNKQMAHTIGMFVKTLPVYAKFTVDTTVLEYLQAGQEIPSSLGMGCCFPIIN